MASIDRGRLPMKVTYFFLSCVGFGVAETKQDRRLLNISLSAFFLLSALSIYFAVTNFYINWRRGVISETIAALFCLLTASLTNFKLILFTLQRTPYEHLLRLTNDTIWVQSFTDYGEIVLKNCQRRAELFLFIFVILGHASGAGWIIEPLVLNMANNNNSSHRHLPTEVIIGVPLYVSPNYEIFFAINALGIYIITILYFCFDYYLVLVNIFVVGQFEILRQRFEAIYSAKSSPLMIDSDYNEKTNQRQDYSPVDCILREFKSCAKQHQFLISLLNEIESIYNIVNLVQVLMMSLIICIVGYPMLMPESALTVMKNGVFISSCLIQLLTFTLSCHDIMIASATLGDGIYFSGWYQHENHSEARRLLSKNFMIVLRRCQCPCYLTGCGFFPVTLDTLKSILTTALSYLTLMRQSMAQ